MAIFLHICDKIENIFTLELDVELLFKERQDMLLRIDY